MFHGPEDVEGRTGRPEARDEGSRTVAVLSSSRETAPFSQAPCKAQRQPRPPAPEMGSRPPRTASEEGSGKEDHKDDEEDNEDEEDFDHEPPIGGDRLEVLEDL